MDTKELHAYIQGPDFQAVTKWIETVVDDIEQKEMTDLTREIGQIIGRFDGKHESLVLEQHVDSGWLELTIRPRASDSIFAEWDNLKLGELLVDDLGGITLVDCGGIYTDPFSPYNVRISSDRMELVELPATIGEPFDESKTRLIKVR